MLNNYKAHPEKIILVGYMTIILIGTLFLILPVSVNNGQSISFIDALFTSTSSVCVTGLIVKDTQYYFSPFGQSVILLLLQIGGLGYMTLSTALILIVSKNISGPSRYQTQTEFQRFTVSDIKAFVFKIIQFTIIAELIGMVLLLPRMIYLKGNFLSGAWNALFHSVSAFCNAGFSIFSDNLLAFASDPYVSLIIAAQIVAGGLGFIVIGDIFRKIRRKSSGILSVHTRIVFISTAVLIVIPFFIFYFLERTNTLSDLTIINKITATLFQVITPRTAGFNTLNIGALTLPTLFFIIMLMFIGGSPGSTAGGIKTTTVFIIFYTMIQKLRGRKNVNLFFRRISDETILKAFFIFTLSVMVTFAGLLALLILEDKSVIKIMFEVFSAYGTVGLSMGSDMGANYSLSGDFSVFGKLIIIIIMFTGRIGIMTAANAFISRSRKESVSYPETRIMVG